VVSEKYPVKGCGGTPSQVENFTTGVCHNFSKYSCSGSFSPPSRYLGQNLIAAGDCNGDVLVHAWQALDICVPSSSCKNESSLLVWNTTTNRIVETSYANNACSGSNNNNGGYPMLPNSARSSYVATSSLSIGNQIYYYTYDNDACSGTPIAGQASRIGSCSGDRVIANCSSTDAFEYYFSDSPCKGDSFLLKQLPLNNCTSRQKAFCSGTFDIPSGAIVNSQYDTTSCHGATPITASFQLPNICVADSSNTGSSLTYFNDSSSEIVTFNYYQRNNCTGLSDKNTNTAPSSFTSFYSGSTLTVTLSRSVFVIIVSLCLYMIIQ